MRSRVSGFFENLEIGRRLEGTPFKVSRETIQEFCDASLDYNPLHLDDEYMKGNFGNTNFGGVIMHGMSNFGLITKMLTDWAYAASGIHRRLETRWHAPVRPEDTICASGVVSAKKSTAKSRWAIIDVEVLNQRHEKIASGQALIEFPVA
jgi:3-hydroxybutyryl-CoA dehydratase